MEIPVSTFSTATMNATLADSSTSSKEATPSTLAKVSELAGRILLAALFLVSGLGKIGGYAATAAYMSSLGVPGALLPLVIATEVFGSIAIMLGWKTRMTAFLLAGFTLLTAFVFHNNFADQVQSIMFLKNVSIAGAFLVLVGRGAGSLSIDHRLARRPV
jgi:putative oxidoreductase